MQSQIIHERSAAPFLQRVIRGNALYCALAGVGLILFPGTMASWLGISSAVFITLFGGGMLLYGVLLYSRAGKDPRRWGLIATELDLLWIIGSVLLVITRWLPLTTEGLWAVALAADGVLFFFVLQLIGLRRLSAKNKSS